MKKIFVMVFVSVFAAITLPTVVKAAVACGVPGTEGLPTCSATSKPGEACCVPPYYKGIKTVVKSGSKTQAQLKTPAVISHQVTSAATTASMAANTSVAHTNTSAAQVKPQTVVQSASSSVSATTSTQSTPAMAAPAASSAPSVPVSTGVSSAKAAKAAK